MGCLCNCRASKPVYVSGWHQPLFDAFSFRKASKVPLLGLYGRVAVAHVQGFGLKAIAPLLT
jgi:hypothetical protein